jgi:hypothetical protein
MDLCAASRLMAESYGFMFGPKGMVTGVLNQDVEENTGGFERATGKLLAGGAAGADGKPVPLTLVEEVLDVECVLPALPFTHSPPPPFPAPSLFFFSFLRLTHSRPPPSWLPT